MLNNYDTDRNGIIFQVRRTDHLEEFKYDGILHQRQVCET